MTINASNSTAEQRDAPFLAEGFVNRPPKAAKSHDNDDSSARGPLAQVPGRLDSGDEAVGPAGALRSGFPRSRPVGGSLKRAIDVVVATTTLVLALPIILCVALLIKLSTGGPVLFSHRRIGFRGRSFACYKFRTMVENSAEALESYLRDNPEAAREWQATQKLRHDPRLIPFGQMLRKSSIDELPQLLNVLKGEMSCVGPRPVIEEELQRYGSRAAVYLAARPGLTGLWQVSGRNKVDYDVRVGLDTTYIRNWSVWKDFAILMRTVGVLIRFDQTS